MTECELNHNHEDHDHCECEHHHEHEEHDHEEHCGCGHHHHDEHHHDDANATYYFQVTGIDCPNCAARLAGKIAQIDGLSNVSLSFEDELLSYDCAHYLGKEMAQKVKELIAQEEPDAVVTSKGHEHHHHEEHDHEEHCDCGHHHHDEHEHCDCEHHHEHDEHEHEEHHHHDEHHHDEDANATYHFQVTGIDCADCAAKLEGKITRIEGISNVSLSFMNSTLVYDCAHDLGKEMEQKVRELIAKEEPDAVMTSKGHEHHHHDHEEHHHEHHYETTEKTQRFLVENIDCADCAARLEGKIAGIKGISNVSLSFMNSTLTYDCEETDRERIEEEMRAVCAKEEPDTVVTRIDTAMKHCRFSITGIDCADCANDLEYAINRTEGVHNAVIDFMNSTLVYDCEKEHAAETEQRVRETIRKQEPDVVLSAQKTQHRSRVVQEEEDDRNMRIRLLLGAVLFVCGLFLHSTSAVLSAAVSLAAWLVLGYDVLIKAFKGIGRGQLFDEHFLMAVATIAAIYLKDYREAAGVMLFYQIGEYFQDLAVRRSRRSIGELMDIRSDYAFVQRGGEYVEVDPEDVMTGEIIRVRPGEKVPLDGIIVSGASSLDTSSLTGESRPRDVDVNDEIISGSVNGSGVLEIKVTKEFGQSTVAKVLELVENGSSSKAKTERFISRFSRWYTPTVVISAIIVALIVSFTGHGVNEGIRRACTFLVISCPCALVISIPLSFFSGIGGLSSRGVLVKGANVIEGLAEVTQVVMDKTGTLTSGRFAVEDTIGQTVDREILIRDAAYAECHSNHPIAVGIKEAYGKDIDEHLLTEVKEIAGRGMMVIMDGHEILAGNRKLMQDHGVDCPAYDTAGTLVYVARDDEFEGCVVLRDQLKEDALDTVKALHDAGRKCWIVSGDNAAITKDMADRLGVDGYFAECLPADKVEHLKKLAGNGKTAFVGDGVNDAPVLAAADVSFAMGALGSDAAIEAADVVLMDDSPSKISLAIDAARRILTVAKQNIYVAIGIKVLVLVLGAFGIANMWMAIFADTGVAMLCVLNSLRLLRISGK
ncbi:MAG: cadmium-translocating P-type ATPase [Erysipelotrichaceae bacterium]|nr:cadmium-translocating P-type ATPase [Erysipelotrichaceae bacterium]